MTLINLLLTVSLKPADQTEFQKKMQDQLKAVSEELYILSHES